MDGTSAIIPAAGRGERLGHSEPKAFVPLGGIPILAWTLAALESAPSIQEIIVVTRPEDRDRAWRLAVEAGCQKLSRVVDGAPDRQNSVLNGVEAANPNASVILVHDAARPFCPVEVFDRCAEAARQHGAATAALPVTDTLRTGVLNTDVGPVIDRLHLVRVQTPQAIRGDILRGHLSACREAALAATDDTIMIERAAGITARLVQGSELSLKITGPGDLSLAEALILQGAGVHPARSTVAPRARKSASLRMGLGYDVHAFAEGRPLFLGGILIPGAIGLKGHSDADAALHALCDAILGAVGQRDIGYHFPDSDPAYAGADSGELLRQVVKIAESAGWTPCQADLSIIAEQPRLSAHMDCMRARLAELLSVPLQQVAVKATTNEKMGFVGRGEGIACLALVTLLPI